MMTQVKVCLTKKKPVSGDTMKSPGPDLRTDLSDLVPYPICDVPSYMTTWLGYNSVNLGFLRWLRQEGN